MIRKVIFLNFPMGINKLKKRFSESENNHHNHHSPCHHSVYHIMAIATHCLQMAPFCFYLCFAQRERALVCVTRYWIVLMSSVSIRNITKKKERKKTTPKREARSDLWQVLWFALSGSSIAMFWRVLGSFLTFCEYFWKPTSNVISVIISGRHRSRETSLCTYRTDYH